MTLFFRMYQMLNFRLYFSAFFIFSKCYTDFSNFFFQFIPKQNGPATFTSLSFKISPKCPIIFCNPWLKNRAKVLYILKTASIWNVIDRPPQNPHLLFPSIYSPLVAHQRLLWRRFLGRTPKNCTTNLGIWWFFRAETYNHFIAQEPRIIQKLFVFNFFFIKKGQNRQCKSRIFIGISCHYYDKFMTNWAKITIFPNLW